MLTTSRSYDVDLYRRSGQGMSLMMRNQVLSDNCGGQSYPTGRESHPPDYDCKTAPVARKRVPVACERCRKRKIKCSGDQGDGSGCDNCKNVGFEGCQFLRVRSEALQCTPTYNASRWHGHHYHPYSRPQTTHHTNQDHQAQQSQHYAPHHISSYSTWQNGVEYGGIPAATSVPVSWNPSGYAGSYSLYDAEQTSPYSTHSQSCMLPDPGHGARSGMPFMGSLSRSQHAAMWLDPINSASVPQQNAHVVSPVYPLTPAESTKSYSLLGQPTHSSLSYERILPTPTLPSVAPAMPSLGQETPPLSAASHRSSHTWTTDSASNISAGSSRTSCGGSQDLTAPLALTACDDQAVAYPYQADESSPQLSIPAVPLSMASESDENQTEMQQFSQVVRSQETAAAQLRHRSSRDILRTSSPILYDYPIRSTIRRPHGMLPPRLMTTFGAGSLSIGWDQPSAPTLSRHNPATSQRTPHRQDMTGENYIDCNERGTMPVLGSTY